jgi:competence protein ComEC
MIKTPDNNYMMIDTGKAGYNGGKSQAEIIMLKYFADNGIDKLKFIVVTHFDNDHCGGTVDLLNGLNVSSVYVNSLNHTSNQAQEIYKTAKNKNVKLTEAQNNQIIYNNNGVKITNYIVKDVPGIGDNESSVITLLSYGEFSMLFTGDAGTQTLNKLELPKNISVLKVGHHGAAGVINKTIANYLNPKYSIISTGENKFGHPSIYTIETLRNSKILRTDINNSVKFIVTPNNYKALTYDAKEKKFKN